MSNNAITLPIKTLEIDRFIKLFKNETNIKFEKLHKSKNHNKNIKSLKAELMKNMSTKFTKKQMKDIKILKTILKERDVSTEVIHHQNKLFLKKLKKAGIKVSDENTYKMVKKSALKRDQWRARTYDVLKKGSKMFFSVHIDLNQKGFNSQKKITLLEDTNILEKVLFYKKLNNISFIPKIVEIIIVYNKSGNIDGIKVISDYIKGLTLEDYLKKHKLTYNKEATLKKNIIEKFNVLKKKGFRYGSYNMGKDIIIDNNHKIFLTGIRFLVEYKFNTNEHRLEYVFNKEYYHKEHLGFEDLILYSLYKKKKLIFKSK